MGWTPLINKHKCLPPINQHSAHNSVFLMLLMLENGIGSDVSNVIISDASWWIQCLIYNYTYVYVYILCMYIYIYVKLSFLYRHILYIYTYMYTYFFSTIISLNPPNPEKSQTFWRIEHALSLLISLLKNAFWEGHKGYRFRWLVPPK